MDLAYDGTEFSGWARQPDRRTVQQVVETALGTVLRQPDPPVTTVAGRTDAGVHALRQVAHVDVDGDVEVERLARGVSGLLPPDVALRSLSVAPAGFDARFAALSRWYRYRVCDGVPNPLRRRDTLYVRRPLDVERMRQAGGGLLGEHDFAAYAKTRPGASTRRRLIRLDVDRADDGVIAVVAQADAFCHNQMRSMVGALLAVGEGRREVGWPAAVLAAGIRDSAVTVAPAHGLTLLAVDYPAEEGLAERVAVTRQRRT